MIFSNLMLRLLLLLRETRDMMHVQLSHSFTGTYLYEPLLDSCLLHNYRTTLWCCTYISELYCCKLVFHVLLQLSTLLMEYGAKRQTLGSLARKAQKRYSQKKGQDALESLSHRALSIFPNREKGKAEQNAVKRERRCWSIGSLLRCLKNLFMQYGRSTCSMPKKETMVCLITKVHRKYFAFSLFRPANCAHTKHLCP